MADEKSIILQGKYEKALVHIRELEQERDRLNKKIEDDADSRKITDRATKNLCIDILKKKKVKKIDKKEDSKKNQEDNWRNLDMQTLLDRAQTWFDEYVKEKTELLHELNERNQKRRKENEDLKKNFENMNEKLEASEKKVKQSFEKEVSDRDALIQILTKKLSTGRISEKEMQKIFGGKIPDDMKVKTVLSQVMSMNVEKADEIDDEIKETAERIDKKTYVREIDPGPVVKNPNAEEIRKKIRERERKREEVSSGRSKEEIQNISNAMTDKQKMFIRVLGEYGVSEFSEICEKIWELDTEDQKKTTSPIRTTARSLLSPMEEEMPPMIKITPVSGLPGVGGETHLYELTPEGRESYEYLFSKPAVDSEVKIMLNEHTSIMHAYGIKKTAQLLMESEYVKKNNAEVIYHTRNKEYSLKINEKLTYIPDIVIVKKLEDGREGRMYIEYETGECTDKDFIAKCAKITYLKAPACNIYIIVPDKNIKELTQNKVSKWKRSISEDPEMYMHRDNAYVYIRTFLEIKGSNDSKQIDWGQKIQISKPKKKGVEEK